MARPPLTVTEDLILPVGATQAGLNPKPIEPPKQKPLTKRQLQVLTLVCKGYTNHEIADMLFISVRAVKWHTWNLFRIKGVKSRAQFIVKVMQESAQKAVAHV